MDDIAELKDELEDMMAENAERQDYFAGVAREGEDELLGELDELEAEFAANELNKMDINPEPIKPKPIVEEEAEADEEKQLKAMMGGMM